MATLGALETALGLYRFAKPAWRSQRWPSDHRLVSFLIAPPFPGPRRARPVTERIAGAVQLLLGILFLAVGVYELGLAL
jgi:hypothetical protein